MGRTVIFFLQQCTCHLRTDGKDSDCANVDILIAVCWKNQLFGDVTLTVKAVPDNQKIKSSSTSKCIEARVECFWIQQRYISFIYVKINKL
jgi:hypothetical protein